jgi:hypothetical protein
VATVAELLNIVVGDPELRAELGARAQRRLDHFAYDAVGRRLRERLAMIGAG